MAGRRDRQDQVRARWKRVDGRCQLKAPQSIVGVPVADPEDLCARSDVRLASIAACLGWATSRA